MSGEAAEEFVRIMLNGTEVLVRLTGSAAKSLASLLIEWNRSNRTALPDSPLYRLFRSGEPLQVVTLEPTHYARFKEAVGSQFPYAPFQNALSKDEIEVVVPESAMPLVTGILKDIVPAERETGPEKNDAETKKKDSPSRRFSGDAKDRSAQEKSSGAPLRTAERESVLKKLGENREHLRTTGSAPEKRRQKQRPAGRNR